MGQQVGILKYQLGGKRHRAWPITCSHLQPEKFCGNNFVFSTTPYLEEHKSGNLHSGFNSLMGGTHGGITATPYIDGFLLWLLFLLDYWGLVILPI